LRRGAVYLAAFTRSTLPRRNAHSDSALCQIFAYEVVLQVGIDFEYRDGSITQGVCNAARTLFATITARVRVVVVKRVNRLEHVFVGYAGAEMTSGAKSVALTDRALAALLCQQSIL